MMVLGEVATRVQRLILAADPEACWVGGCVRDALLGQCPKDLDVVVQGDPMELAVRVARSVGGSPFWLDPEEGVARVHVAGEELLQVDFCRRRGTLEEDLRARDLTINAMAMRLVDGAVVDPTRGRTDLRAGVIRFVGSNSAQADPLRCLRALRFRWKLGFEMEPDTATILRVAAPGLERVSGERRRDELFFLLNLADPYPAVRECFEYGLGPWTFGTASAPAHLKGRLEAALRLLAEPEGAAVWGQHPTGDRTRRALALLGAIVEGNGPVDLVQTLALSRDEARLLTGGTRYAALAAALLKSWPVAGRERRAFRKAARQAGPEAVLMAGIELPDLIDPWRSLFRETVAETLNPTPPLLTGDDIMHCLHLPPSPQVRVWLDRVEDERADGRLDGRDAALQWLRDQPSAAASL